MFCSVRRGCRPDASLPRTQSALVLKEFSMKKRIVSILLAVCLVAGLCSVL